MKRKILILTLGLMMAVSAKAQIFVLEDESNNRAEAQPGLGIDLPGYGEGTDYYAPVGSGIFLLTAFGGAYLLGKRNIGKRNE